MTTILEPGPIGTAAIDMHPVEFATHYIIADCCPKAN